MTVAADYTNMTTIFTNPTSFIGTLGTNGSGLQLSQGSTPSFTVDTTAFTGKYTLTSVTYTVNSITNTLTANPGTTTYTLPNSINGNVTITALWSPRAHAYTTSVTPVATATITPAASGSIDYGVNLVFQVTPTSGNAIATTNGVSYSVNGLLVGTLTAVGGNYTIPGNTITGNVVINVNTQTTTFPAITSIARVTNKYQNTLTNLQYIVSVANYTATLTASNFSVNGGTVQTVSAPSITGLNATYIVTVQPAAGLSGYSSVAGQDIYINGSTIPGLTAGFV